MPKEKQSNRRSRGRTSSRIGRPQKWESRRGDRAAKREAHERRSTGKEKQRQNEHESADHETRKAEEGTVSKTKTAGR